MTQQEPFRKPAFTLVMRSSSTSGTKTAPLAARGQPSSPYLDRVDAARTLRRVGRVLEDPVPVQGPQAHVGEEQESRHEQPGDLQQPLLSPPHVSDGSSPRAGTTFGPAAGTDCGAVRLRGPTAPPLGGAERSIPGGGRRRRSVDGRLSTSLYSGTKRTEQKKVLLTACAEFNAARIYFVLF